jgi:hypothetical protein
MGLRMALAAAEAAAPAADPPLMETIIGFIKGLATPRRALVCAPPISPRHSRWAGRPTHADARSPGARALTCLVVRRSRQRGSS